MNKLFRIQILVFIAFLESVPTFMEMGFVPNKVLTGCMCNEKHIHHCAIIRQDGYSIRKICPPGGSAVGTTPALLEISFCRTWGMSCHKSTVIWEYHGQTCAIAYRCDHLEINHSQDGEVSCRGGIKTLGKLGGKSPPPPFPEISWIPGVVLIRNRIRIGNAVPPANACTREQMAAQADIPRIKT